MDGCIWRCIRSHCALAQVSSKIIMVCDSDCLCVCPLKITSTAPLHVYHTIKAAIFVTPSSRPVAISQWTGPKFISWFRNVSPSKESMIVRCGVESRWAPHDQGPSYIQFGQYTHPWPVTGPHGQLASVIWLKPNHVLKLHVTALLGNFIQKNQLNLLIIYIVMTQYM